MVSGCNLDASQARNHSKSTYKSYTNSSGCCRAPSKHARVEKTSVHSLDHTFCWILCGPLDPLSHANGFRHHLMLSSTQNSIGRLVRGTHFSCQF